MLATAPVIADVMTNLVRSNHGCRLLSSRKANRAKSVLVASAESPNNVLRVGVCFVAWEQRARTTHNSFWLSEARLFNRPVFSRYSRSAVRRRTWWRRSGTFLAVSRAATPLESREHLKPACNRVHKIRKQRQKHSWIYDWSNTYVYNKVENISHLWWQRYVTSWSPIWRFFKSVWKHYS